MKNLICRLNLKSVVKIAILAIIIVTPIIGFLPDRNSAVSDSGTLIAQTPPSQQKPVQRIQNSGSGIGHQKYGNSWGG